MTAELHLFDGFSHTQYLSDPTEPETLETFGEVARFLDEHLQGL